LDNPLNYLGGSLVSGFLPKKKRKRSLVSGWTGVHTRASFDNGSFTFEGIMR